MRRTVANGKITKLKMTYELILRAAVTFTVLLTLGAAWAPAKSIATWLFWQVQVTSLDYPLIEPQAVEAILGARFVS